MRIIKLITLTISSILLASFLSGCYDCGGDTVSFEVLGTATDVDIKITYARGNGYLEGEKDFYEISL